MSTQLNAATENSRLTQQALEYMFGDANCRYDLKEGTANTPTERVIYLSEDLINGIHYMLSQEVADAWRQVLNTCGYVWGKQVAGSLNRQLQIGIKAEIGQLSVSEYLAFIESYFAKHGWGKAVIHLDDAEQYGIVRVSLFNSLFANTLSAVKGPVDFMVAGMLRGLFEKISGRELGCVQVSWQADGKAGACEFLVSAPNRIDAIRSSAEQGVNVQDAIAQLRSA